MKTTLVRELMENAIIKIDPAENLYEASKKMKDAGCGFLVVGTRKKPVGIITDRDIVVRAVAQGCDPIEEKVQDYMSPVVILCRDNDTLANAARKMYDHKISRLLVSDAKGTPCGVLSFGKILRMHEDQGEMAEVIELVTGRAGWKAVRDDDFPEYGGFLP